MSYTAKELEKAIVKAYEATNDDKDYGNVWESFKWEYTTSLEVPSFGTVVYENSYGGEGCGDDYWVVVKLNDRYFRVSGYYDSWNGGELDGELEEVIPKEVKKIEWETK